MGKGGYRGGSTIVRVESDWVGHSEYDPATWGPKEAKDTVEGIVERVDLPEIDSREVVVARQRAKAAKRRARRAEKKNTSPKNSCDERLLNAISREKRILEKYPEANLFFKNVEGGE